MHDDRGIALIEQLLVIAIIIIVLGAAIPITSETLDSVRTASASRYLASRIVNTRMDAIKRSMEIALRFEAGAGDYTYRSIGDGNNNGVRTLDIQLGIDVPLDLPERIGDNFSGVRLGLFDGIPDADGALGTGTDGVRIGKPKILTMTPSGTATAGTIYVRGRGAQYAVRILGTTGRVRVVEYVWKTRRWVDR